MASKYSVKQFQTRSIKMMGLLFLIFPISFVFLIGVLFDIPLNILLRLFVSPWFILLSIFGIILGYGILEMKRWVWWLYWFVFLGMLIHSFYFLIKYGETHHKLLAFSVECFIFAIMTYALKKEFVTPYTIPRIKWWENDSDQFFHCKVKIRNETQEEFIGDLLDISFKGCFIKMKDRIALDDDVELSLNAFGQGLTCRGMIVWHADSVVTHPRGLGVRFEGFDKRAKRVLKMFIHRLGRIQEVKRIGIKGFSVNSFFRNLNILQSLDARVISPPKIIKKISKVIEKSKIKK